MKVCVNVKPLVGTVTGIERYMLENLSRMALLASEYDFELEGVCPRGSTPSHTELKELRVHEVDGKGIRFLRHVRAYLRREHALYVNMSGGIALRGGVVVFHDARPALHPEYDSRGSRIRFNAALAYARRRAAKVVVPSEFTKRMLVERLGFDASDIVVIPNAWQHMQRIAPDESVFDMDSRLKKGTYYYALGSLAPHKNVRWIVEAAKLNPGSLFVVSGKRWDESGDEVPVSDNLIYVGYLTDEQSKALMTHCKAFLHPSLYEGFGIPPLEAASCGAPLVVSNAGSLPEVLGRNAAYIDPNDWHVSLDDLLADTYGERVARGGERPDHTELLAKYSWDDSARRWMELLQSLTEERSLA